MIVLVTLCPRVTFKLLGEADRLKSGVGAEALTVKLAEVVCVKLPEVPVTVTVMVPTAAGDAFIKRNRHWLRWKHIAKIDRHCDSQLLVFLCTRTRNKQTQLRFHNADGIEWWVAIYLDGVLGLLADDCRLF